MKKFQRPAIGTLGATVLSVSAVTLGAVGLGTVTAAGEARADSRDDTFYDMLTMEGLDCESKYFRCPDGSGDLVAIGMSACGEMMRGASKSDTVSKLGDLKPSMSRKQVLTFVNIAAAVYCPNYL